jgi:hypothetical protein
MRLQLSEVKVNSMADMTELLSSSGLLTQQDSAMPLQNSLRLDIAAQNKLDTKTTSSNEAEKLLLD